MPAALVVDTLAITVERLRPATPVVQEARSPWMNPDEHREARSDGLARRDEARIAALFVQGATKSVAVQRGCSAPRMPPGLCPRAPRPCGLRRCSAGAAAPLRAPPASSLRPGCSSPLSRCRGRAGLPARATEPVTCFNGGVRACTAHPDVLCFLDSPLNPNGIFLARYSVRRCCKGRVHQST